MAIEIISGPGGVSIWLKVVPGASRSRVIGKYGGALKVSVTQPPEDGRANSAVVEVLATALRISAINIQITHGHSSPRKQVRIQGMTADAVRKILQSPPSKRQK